MRNRRFLFKAEADNDDAIKYARVNLQRPNDDQNIGDARTRLKESSHGSPRREDVPETLLREGMRRSHATRGGVSVGTPR